MRDAIPRSYVRQLLWWVVGFWLLRLGLLAWIHAGDISLHVDEAQYWDWSRNLQWGYYSKPPMIAALIAASTTLFGDSEIGIKALVILCYSVTAGLLYGFTRGICRHQGEPADSAYAHTAGLWAALCFLASPLVGILSLSATTDAPLLMCWTGAMWAGWCAFHKRNAQRVLFLGLILGLGLLSKYTMAALMAGMGLAWLVLGVWHKHHLGKLVLWFALACGVALAVLTPNLMWNAAYDWPTLQHTAEITTGRDAGASRTLWQGIGSATGFALGQFILIGPLVLLCVAFHYFTSRRPKHPQPDIHLHNHATTHHSMRSAAVYLACCVLPLLLVGLIQAWRSKAQINWIAPALLPVFIWLGIQIAQIQSPKTPSDGTNRARTGVYTTALLQFVLIIGIAVLPVVWSMASPRTLPPKALDLWARMRGWQSGFDQLQRTLPPDSNVRVLIAQSRAMHAQAAYHTRHWGANGSSPLPPKAWMNIPTPQQKTAVHSHYELIHPWYNDTIPNDVQAQDAIWWLYDKESKTDTSTQNIGATMASPPKIAGSALKQSGQWRAPQPYAAASNPSGDRKIRTLSLYRSVPTAE